MPTAEDYIEAGLRAADDFSIDAASMTVLSESENVVLDVTLADDSHMVMRLHRSGYNTLEELDSEVAFVDSLREFGIPVPRAVPTTAGGHYTTVEVAGQPRHVGMVHWVPGQPLGGPLNDAGEDVLPHYGRIGEIAAQIRLHNTTWTAPTGFVRRRWDADGLVGSDPLWGRFWQVDALSDSHAALFADARLGLHEELRHLSVGDDRFGLIHSDLHLGNLMAEGDDLAVIDFDDAGYGWFAHELAVALHPVMEEPMFAAAKASLLDGYRTVFALDAAEEQLIDTFLVVRSLMIVGWLAARPELPVYELLGEVIDSAAAASEQYLS